MSLQPSLPDDPRLAEIARELTKTRGANMLCDADWNLVWVSEELKDLIGERDDEKIGYGKHLLEVYLSPTWISRVTPESMTSSWLEQLPVVMHGTPGGRERLTEIIKRGCRALGDSSEFGLWTDEAIDAVMEAVEPRPPLRISASEFDFVQTDELPPMKIYEVHVRLNDDDGEFLGNALMFAPALPAQVLTLVARGDEGMFTRMAGLIEPGRQRAAVLFADLQSSTSLSRKLPSAAYFKLVRAITTAMDEVVVAENGIVGKHVGDGVTAFFLAKDIGSSSAAARAAIEAARNISTAAAIAAKEVGEETGLIEAADCLLNIAVHWGGTLYMGQLVTGGRLEVTALGDEVNECARIQESARDGEILASKTLLEHLSPSDAQSLGIDPDGVVYKTVSELDGAGSKAVRDAGGIPVTPL